MRKYSLLIYGLLLVLFLGITNTVYATPPSTLSYTATMIPAKNQIDEKKSYFDLLVTPGEEQQVAIKLNNASDKMIKLKVSPNTAKTTSNGTVDYSGMELENTPNLIASFEEITSKEQIVELAGNSEKVVTFTIKIPKKPFEGIILGGFYIQEIDEEETVSSKEGIHIANQFSMIIGCQMRMSEESVKKNFSLEKIYLDNYGGYFTVVTDIHNNASQLISFYSLLGEIQNDQGETIHKFRKDTFSMAPNSIFSLPERIDNSKLDPGEYVMKIDIHSRGEEQWKLQKKFTIQSDAKDKVLEKSIDRKKTQINWLLLTIVLIISITVLLILIQLKKHKN
ncbi:DUF916 domain-containing protein [Enterococcus sp. DIV0242_7C1]|uniref:Uncharacterized protein n=2 Tax=Candidatus Enterococcus dunnyi TaxID=1834192 RepID=A0A200J1A9_9ENTE|nr:MULTISPECIES: DUF916 domain-containing protein [unclassified Enterococcus]MBO0470289.1 DUF916 domain-containing protein [Enterococcus sp. DIV0242_7C1]OUZ30345.1 hypothetical protein A5889_002633 [Enterococcus sp. 9D6_DIV0238]